ncbi:hypothetical protein GOODEAATRI_026381 [Goodea atripinnis]|uniref:Uncharacterized protein n=1 Tax=Goodea atripinnis TaxID=208336 RepID=A0ABV0N5F2_9TELE
MMQHCVAMVSSPADVDAQVSTDVADATEKSSLQRRQQCFCLCYHGEDWSGGHVFAESCVERHVLQVKVVLLHVVFRGLGTESEDD